MQITIIENKSSSKWTTLYKLAAGPAISWLEFSIYNGRFDRTETITEFAKWKKF